MKKRLLSIIIVLLGMVSGALADVTIDENHFPDWHFRSYVKDYCQPDLIDGVLTDSEIAQITEINAVDLNIEDLTGIEYFTELKELDVFGNSLTSIDVSQNTKLERLDCGSNQLTSIDVSKNTVLRKLFCSGNQLTSLDVSNNPKLAYLDCSNNQIGYAEMKKLVESLPLNQPTTELPIGLFTVLDRDNDQNIITAAQVDIAKAKNWRVVSYSPYGGSEDYNGFVDIPINATNFPDYNFRSWVRSNCDTGNDGFLSYEEIEARTSIDVTARDIVSLKGIEYFTALTDLKCGGNRQMSELDVSKNTALTKLSCGGNQMTSLNVSNNTALTELDCGYNKLPALDVSGCTALTELDCGSNQLTELDVSNCTALEYLICDNNQLTELDVSKNTALTALSCSGNQLTTLDMTGCTALTVLSCSGNQLTTLDLTGCTVLTDLHCYDNKLEALDVSNCTALTFLRCYDNQLMSLNVSDCTALRQLFCYNNKLISLNVSECTALGMLNCSNNQLINLFVSNYMAALSFLQCNNNQISGKEMTSLIDNLPTLDGLGLFRVYNPDGTDGNLISTVQAKAAEAKNWRVLTSDDFAYYGVVTGIAIDATNFPDDIFRQQVNKFDKDYDGFLSPEEIASVKQVLVPEMGISDLKGIEYFTAMTMLVCNNNQLTSLYLSNNTELQALECYGNQIQGADMTDLIESLPDQDSPTELRVYYEGVGDGNEMTTLQVKAAKAKKWMPKKNDGSGWVDYSGVPFSIAIDEDNFHDEKFRNWLLGKDYGADGVLTEEEIGAITTLDVSGLGIEDLSGVQYFTSLTKLVCSNNKIEALWLSANTAITELCIDNNQIWGYMMKTLIRDLSDNGGVIRVISSSATEGNGITTQQVNTLKAKGWSVLKSDGTEYEGIAQGVPINERSFPDQMFNYMVRRGVDSDGDEYLNEVELRNWTSFGDVLVNRQIKSLEGIEYFTSLNELKCWINNIDGSFVSLLPVTTDGKLYYFYGEGRDFNTMTPAQVYTANQKGWRVLREDGSDYLGVIVEGDADGNGEVGTQDVERLSDYILGRNSSAFSLKSADLDDNGTVDITDLTLLIEKLKKVKR